MIIKTLHVNKAFSMEESITACIGYFDGLHIGHQKLIEKVLNISKHTNTKSALITFDPDPWVVIKGLTDIPHITPMKHRMRIAEKMGIEYWIILDFSKEMADLSPEEFIEKILKPLHLHTLVCGFDFTYGRKGEGSIEELKAQSDFQVAVIDEVSSEHKKISSTRIEQLLMEGKMEKAASFMGRWYDIEGVVKGGSHVGHKQGFPTANLHLLNAYVIPKKGVYIGGVKVKEKWHKAMINVGNNPTYNYKDRISIEAHILDFDETIYDEYVTFRFLSYIRDEHKFENTQALIDQLNKDLHTTREYFVQREESFLCD